MGGMYAAKFFDRSPESVFLAAGGERKSTGSYYTPSVLVQELIKSALDPVIQQALDSASDVKGQRAALLDLSVCDPACGSGHFLLAAARRIVSERTAKIADPALRRSFLENVPINRQIAAAQTAAGE